MKCYDFHALTTNCIISLWESVLCGFVHPSEYSTFTFHFPEWAPCIWPREETVKSKASAVTVRGLAPLTLRDLRKLEWKTLGEIGSDSENKWDIFTSLTPNIPLGITARQMSNMHLLLLRPVVGNCSSLFYIHVFLLFFCSSVCASLCAELSWGPWESETAERPDPEGC